MSRSSLSGEWSKSKFKIISSKDLRSRNNKIQIKRKVKVKNEDQKQKRKRKAV
jgi:hypothetical protein